MGMVEWEITRSSLSLPSWHCNALRHSMHDLNNLKSKFKKMNLQYTSSEEEKFIYLVGQTVSREAYWILLWECSIAET